jgi:hypothetical protein
VTRIPELEQELVAAAARLQSPRRLVPRPMRAALVAAAAAGVVALAVVVTTEENAGDGRTRPTGPSPSGQNVKPMDDIEAGIRFRLDGRVLTVTLLESAPERVRNQVSSASVRATCGETLTRTRDPWPTRKRLWPAGRKSVLFRFGRDISRDAGWCRLEDTNVGHVAFVSFVARRRAADSPGERKVERIATDWAALFGADNLGWCNYAGQPVCERADCERVGHVPIENCTPLSAGYRRSFLDARVEDVAIRGDRAAVRFSNGEAIELYKDTSAAEHPAPWWWIEKIGGSAGQGFFER